MLENILPNEMAHLIKKFVSLKNLCEIRIRLNAPIILDIAGVFYSINENGLCSLNRGIVCDKHFIESVMYICSNHSMYLKVNQIKQGFLTLDGIRIGVCGEMVNNEENIINIKNIQSLNIRIPHIVLGFSETVFPFICNNNKIHNTLIIAPPGAGKTTLLRDIAMKFTTLKRFINMLIIDERYEIINNLENFNYRVDAIYGGVKSYNIISGIRSMNPKIIFTDELANESDFSAIKYACNSGVNIIATMHGKDVNDYNFKFKCKEKIFTRFIVLSNKGNGFFSKEVFDEFGALLYKDL